MRPRLEVRLGIEARLGLDVRRVPGGAKSEAESAADENLRARWRLFA